jgi:hypothetical protein
MAELGQAIREIAPIYIGSEYLGFLNAPAHNMVESTRCIESRLSGHDIPYVNERILSSCFRTYVPFALKRKVKGERRKDKGKRLRVISLR